MEYLDFDLEIGAGSGLEYPLSVRSPAGEARETMYFPYTQDKLGLKLKDLTIALLRSASITRQVLPAELQSVQEMGRDFFNALFTGDIRTRYDLSQRMAQEQGKGLRVRLRIQSGEISALPWEYLYDPRSCEYIGLSSSTPLIRYLEVLQPVKPIEVDLPLRVLGMVCSPKDLPPLNVELEKRRVDEALADLQKRGLVELNWLPGENWNSLQDTLLDGPWHVFHFIGHGDFDRQRDEGYLVLTGAGGSPRKLYATELARLLADHRDLRLVVLNACGGARSSWESVYSSVAAVLVRRGIACTIAMQFSITDNAAIELSRRLYIMLAKGLPVDTALTEARKSLSIAFTNSIEWGTPVLFMRSPDGRLFDPNIPDHPSKEVDQETGMNQLKAQTLPVLDELEQVLTKELLSSSPTVQNPSTETDSKSADAYINSGNEHYNLKEYQQAIRDYDEALKINPKNAIAYYYRGNAYYELNEYRRAIRNHDKALEINPKYIEAYVNRGLAYDSLGAPIRAIQDYDKALQIDPMYTDAYLYRGLAYYVVGEHGRAIRDFDRAIKINPNDPANYFARGYLYYELEEYEKSIQDYNRALEIDPQDDNAYYYRASAYQILHQNVKAIADLRKLLEISQNVELRKKAKQKLKEFSQR